MKTHQKILCFTLAAALSLGFAACDKETPETPPVPPAPSAHEHVYETAEVAPTRTEQGYTLHACTVENCTESYKTDYTGITGREMKKDRKYSFLFLGNSYTYYNTLWRIFEDLCEAEGFDVDVDVVYEGGWTFEQYADPADKFGTRFREKLEENTYDYVFLQGSPSGFLRSPETFYPAARTLIESVRASGATPVLYATWAKKPGSVWYDETSPKYLGIPYETMIRDDTALYDFIGQELSVPVSHVGTAFYHACAAEPALELYDPDASHPSASGTYLAALCHFATVFGRSPVGIEYAPTMYPVPYALLPVMQEAAQKAVYGPSILTDEYKLEAPPAPAELAYEDRTVTFSPVEGAQSYHVTIERDGKAVADRTVEEPSVQIDSFGAPLQGAYTVKVTARRKVFFSDPASLAIDVKPVDGDILLEAEDAILNDTHFRANTKTHGGAYALNFNSAGQGLYFRYYAVEAGERNVTIRYATTNTNPYVDVYVNAEGERALEKQTRVVFPENTGWFGSITGADVQTALTFTKGWNEIYFIKPSDKTQAPNYGGYVQFDYIVIEGTGKEYDPASVAKPTSYRLEAETAKWHYPDSHTPWNAANSSCTHALGSFDKADTSVTFRFKVEESGTYKLQLCSGGPASGALPDVDISVNGKEATRRTLKVGAGNTVFVLDDGFEEEFTAGEWITVQFSWVNLWVIPDYLLVTKL